jgi:tripartite ATP-independent transporter DctM subunit
MEPLLVGGLIIAFMLILMVFGVPIGFSLGIAAFCGIVWIRSIDTAWNLASMVFYGSVSSYALTVIPLFILMGHLAFNAGIAQKVFSTVQKWVNWLPGGLAIATTASAAIFGACTGASTAAAAVLGRMAVPEMVNRYKYSARLATGCVAASGTLAILIPPSVTMIIYATFVEVPVGKLFVAGIIPGILSALIYIIYIIVHVKINPSLAPSLSERVSWREKLGAVPHMWGASLLFIVIIGGIYLGIFTPTEAGGIAVGVALLMVVIRSGGGRMRGVIDALWRTAGTTSMIFTLVVGAIFFSRFLTLSGFSTQLNDIVIGLAVSPTQLLIAILLLYIPLGMFLGTMPMLALTLPTIWPIVAELGYDPLWFGILIIKMSELAIITPPVCINVYVVKGVVGPEIKLSDIIRGTLYFMVMDIVTIAVLFAFPSLSLWLPGTMD